MAVRFHNTKQFQMSDSFLIAGLAALSGGLQDAYTYCCRDSVFANAQTGNVVLLSSSLFQGNWSQGLHYAIPLLAFLIGIYVAEAIRSRYRYSGKLHWRQFIMIIEAALLFGVGFMPQSLNPLAAAMVSFVCALQVQSFRKVLGNSYASTMCIGNMRSCMEALHGFFYRRDAMCLFQSMIYLGVIVLFGIGAGVGYILTLWLGVPAIWFSCVFLAAAFAVMLADKSSYTSRRHSPRGAANINNRNNFAKFDRRSIMNTQNLEMRRYLSLNEITTGNGTVIFGGARDRDIPVSELKQSFNLNMDVFNRSLSGLTAADAVEAYDLCVAELNPESVLLHIGDADVESFRSSPSAFDSDYRALISHVRECSRKCRICVVSVENAERTLLISEMNRHLRNIAESERCEFCEINGLLWNPRGTQELMSFMYDLGFVRPLKLKRPLYDLARVFYGYLPHDEYEEETEYNISLVKDEQPAERSMDSNIAV